MISKEIDMGFHGCWLLILSSTKIPSLFLSVFDLLLLKLSLFVCLR